MLFHPSKNPVELRVIHLNKSQEQRREDLMEATQGKAALKQLKKTMAKKAKQALKVKSKSKNKKNNSDDKPTFFVWGKNPKKIIALTKNKSIICL